MRILVEDMAWCWWTKPRATRIGQLVYFGALDSAGRIVAATWDLKTRSARKATLAQFESDDHNNPAIVAVAGKPLVAFYARHDLDDVLRYRLGVRPADITDWHDERVLRFGGLTTYAEVHPRGDELHVFTRVDDGEWWYCSSSDWASTWTEPSAFLSFDTDQQVYMATALLADNRTLRVAVSGHPKEYERKPLHDVWVCLVDLETGAVTRPSDGAVVGNLRSGADLPLNYDRLDLVYRTPADRTVNLFDVSDGPVFEVGFVSKVKGDLATVDARYHVTSARDGAWITEDLVDAGEVFGYIPAGLYAGGVAFPNRSPGGQVYVSREAQGLWHLERWDWEPASGWTPHPLCAPSTTRLVRPWALTDPAGGLDVVALALQRYDDDYMNTLSHLVTPGWSG